MTLFLIVIHHELILSLKNCGRIIANFLFFLISLFIFFFISGDVSNHGFAAINQVSVIFLILLFSLTFFTLDFLKAEFDDGSLEQVIITCENFEIFVLAKMLGNWVLYALPLVFISALILSLGNFPNLTHFVVILLLVSLIMNFICAFCGSISMLGNIAPLLAVIAFPLVIPTLIIASGDISVAAEEAHEIFFSQLKMLGGLVVLSGSIATIAITKITKIALE